MKESKYSTYDIRIRAVKAFRQGMSVQEVAKAYSTHRSTIHRWVNRYTQEKGVEGLVRKPGSGRPPKLEMLDRDELLSIVLMPASHFGYETDFWTCRRLRQVIQEKFEISLSRCTVWRRLRDANLTYQKPERRYYEASEETRQEWLQNEAPKIRRAVKKYNAILYFEDESNISLTALLGKT